jgi:hypothetical protein
VTAGATAATSQGDLSVEITQACLLVRFQGPRKWAAQPFSGCPKTSLQSIAVQATEPAFLSGSLANAGLHLQGLYPQKAPTREPSAEGRGRRKPR